MQCQTSGGKICRKWNEWLLKPKAKFHIGFLLSTQQHDNPNKRVADRC